MNKKESEFNKVFSAWDILVIAFGAMIGWGWVLALFGSVRSATKSVFDFSTFLCIIYVGFLWFSLH